MNKSITDINEIHKKVYQYIIEGLETKQTISIKLRLQIKMVPSLVCFIRGNKTHGD